MLKTVVAFVVGILVGAGSVEGVHVIRDHHRREFFDQRLRCKNSAESYAKKDSDDYTSVLLDRTDFSTARNSCVAANTRVENARFWTYQVVDVATGELLFTGFCDNKDSKSSLFCGSGMNINLMHKRDQAFDEAVK